ncbi:J domain-containing protein [Halomicrobium sp. HM KBTZ05]|uniref:DnaJ domain-containing protein n=1 Tax=Halomicrobium mukohataei TaxID=57705 RepID=A0A847U658_9EURY|nr:DnaJ domain-containing protein [Halomicrobium mukohataei]
MFAQFGSLPEWLLVGLGLGVAGSVAVAGLFVAAARLFPPPAAGGSSGTGEGRRREELRSYLRAIEEPFAEDHFVEGQPVAFYLPKRDVAITFDARAYYRIDRSPTVPVLVEHEMPGWHLGARLPFETPAIDGESTGESERTEYHPTADAFRELGLPTSATLEEVKGAYRSKVKEVHPDHGGDEEAFKRVRRAYTRAKQHAAD